jgi:DmsE family decaheme c-type cytochrome
MKSIRSSPGLFLLLAALLLFILTAIVPRSGTAAVSSKGQTPAQAAKDAAQPAAPAGDYVGQDTCMGCHADYHADQMPYHKAIEKNKRWNWSGRTCEACHGPGKAHAEAADPKLIFSFKRAKAQQVDEKCLGCHSQGLKGSNHAFDAHFRNSVSCVNCHSVHASKEAKLLPAKPEKFCVACHSNVKAEFYRPYRHRLLEGEIGCMDCHDPHGSPRLGNQWKAMIREVGANEPACLKCHANIRGPFVYDHVPVRSEGCQLCHEAHGSVNPRMLTRSQVRFVCLECHTNSTTTFGEIAPPAFHNLTTARFQNCTVCHNKIHGSYVDRFFER